MLKKYILWCFATLQVFDVDISILSLSWDEPLCTAIVVHTGDISGAGRPQQSAIQTLRGAKALDRFKALGGTHWPKKWALLKGMYLSSRWLQFRAQRLLQHTQLHPGSLRHPSIYTLAMAGWKPVYELTSGCFRKAIQSGVPKPAGQPAGLPRWPCL